MLRLNTFSNKDFASDGTERGNIISVVRMLAVEGLGREINAMAERHGAAKPYTSIFKTNMEFNDLDRKHKRDIIFAAARHAYKLQERELNSTDFNPSEIADSLYKYPMFLKTLAGYIEEGIAPILNAATSDILGLVGKHITCTRGKAHAINISSNDIMRFEDTSFGAELSAPVNEMHNKTIYMNPQQKVANVQIQYEQFISNDYPISAFYASIIRGRESKIMGMFMEALNSVKNNSKYIPGGMVFDGYTSQHWIQAIQKVAAKSNTSTNNVMAFGALGATKAILPNGTAADAALTWGLGDKWMQGGLKVVDGVTVYTLSSFIIPGTQNTDVVLGIPNDSLWLISLLGSAPIYWATFENDPVSIEFEAMQTQNRTLQISVSTALDVRPVFADAVALIKNVVL